MSALVDNFLFEFEAIVKIKVTIFSDYLDAIQNQKNQIKVKYLFVIILCILSMQ